MLIVTTADGKIRRVILASEAGKFSEKIIEDRKRANEINAAIANPKTGIE